MTAQQAENTARDYYDSEDADNFYSIVWGGEDIHVGLYETPDEEIAAGQPAHRRADGRGRRHRGGLPRCSTSAPATAARRASSPSRLGCEGALPQPVARWRTSATRATKEQGLRPWSSGVPPARSRTSRCRTAASTSSGRRTRSCTPATGRRCSTRSPGCCARAVRSCSPTRWPATASTRRRSPILDRIQLSTMGTPGLLPPRTGPPRLHRGRRRLRGAPQPPHHALQPGPRGDPPPGGRRPGGTRQRRLPRPHEERSHQLGRGR